MNDPVADTNTADGLDGDDADRPLPPLLAMRDTLDRIERNTTDEPALARLSELREKLDRVADRDPGERASHVDDLDHLVDALQPRLDGDAAFWAETVRNRIANYRRTRREASDALHFGSSRLTVDSTEAVDPADHQGEKGHLRGTLVNQGEPGSAIVQLAFYNREGNATWTVESCEFDLEAGERRPLDLHVWIPDDAAYYGVVALDATDPRATGEPPIAHH